MIIGVDAGALSISDDRLKVGVWRVTYNLLKELSKIDKENEYRLYTFTQIPDEFGPRMRQVVLPRRGWSKIFLPLELRRHPVDVFLGLSQMLPPCSAKKIGFIHDLAFNHFPEAYPDSYKPLKRQTEELIRRSDKIIVFSRSTAQEVKHKDVRVIHEAVDAKFTNIGARHRERRPYILFVGALKRGKNVPMAIRIFEKFTEVSKKPYELVIVGGDYWEDPEIKKMLGAKHVKLKGFVRDSELPKYYRGAEALLITSQWEGFCLPAVEALTCGCPVVYRGVASLPEIVGTKGWGFSTEEEAVRALLKKKQRRVGFRRHWDQFAKDVYDQIITYRSARS